ncbi:MAG: ATP-binding protein [Tannerella sp.]|jgi:hypothetical protein|nr:ATP-binding protein [Tannerella sp.]
METKVFKRLPYGISNFKVLRNKNYAYVDKTRFIELLENESNPNRFFIRPRKFGKSLFLTMLRYYYDLNAKDEFEPLFGDLYIGRNPTPERNSYAMLEFDFSGVKTASQDNFVESFSSYVQEVIIRFFDNYKNLFPNTEQLVQRVNEKKSGVDALDTVFNTASIYNINIYLIIDEYDHFANNLIAMGNQQGKDFYETMVKANGLVRNFYEKIKAAGKLSLRQTFITGISPVMLHDVTSGYNIAELLTLDLHYNEMLGFTQAEVDALIDETGVERKFINVDMEACYNGYLFNPDGENRLYNPTMVLSFFKQILKTGKPPTQIIDSNLQMDYGRLTALIRNENNRNTLLEILREGKIVSRILETFSINQLYDEDYFISQLFYLGLLTIKDGYVLMATLCIPNYTIRTLYWEYLAKEIAGTSPRMTVSTTRLNSAINALANEGDVHEFIAYVSENAFSKLSDHDLRQFDEKYIQILLLAYLFMNRLYIPMSEYEAVPGRTDIYLQRNPTMPDVRYEWIFELKYCKASASDAEIAAQREQAVGQLNKYLRSHRLKERKDLKAAAIVFIGKNKFEITEV